MLNTDDFIKRLEFIMEHFGLNASSFADKISVQRSSISHLLSGRNKPSLDFVLKILDVFPELNLYWFLDGSGSYLKNDNHKISFNDTQNPSTPAYENEQKEKNELQKIENPTDLKKEVILPYSNLLNTNSATKQLDKIVFFYTDGTFQDYKPNVPK